MVWHAKERCEGRERGWEEYEEIRQGRVKKEGKEAERKGEVGREENEEGSR